MNNENDRVPKLEEFIMALPSVSSNPKKRIRMLARELALGVHLNYWDNNIHTHDNDIDAASVIPHDENLKQYFRDRWNIEDIQHLWNLLEAHGYLVRNRNYYDKLKGSAFELLDETEPYNVFVSYKRSESSALALLCICRLKEHDLVPFVDMALEAGGNWHADLKERITDCDYFIILLGKDTLASEMTVKEICWAIDEKRTIIPIWHSGFDINSDKWEDVPENVISAIQLTNAIRVTDESASGYNTAIVELLNRFGISP